MRSGEVQTFFKAPRVPKAPRKPMRARSKEMAALYRTERVPLVVVMLAAEPWCQMRLPGCTGRSQCLHEIVKRSAGGSIVDPENIIVCCFRCNGRVEDEPKEAQALGFSRRALTAAREDQ